MTAAELRAMLAKATPGPWMSGGEAGIALTFDREINIFPPDTMESHGFQYGGPVAVVSTGGEGENADLIVALVNHAERFAELLAAEEAKAESRREWTSCRPCDGWDYRVDGVYAGQVWPSSSGEWWWCLRDNLDNGIEPTQLLARAAVEAAVRAGR